MDSHESLDSDFSSSKEKFIISLTRSLAACLDVEYRAGKRLSLSPLPELGAFQSPMARRSSHGNPTVSHQVGPTRRSEYDERISVSSM